MKTKIKFWYFLKGFTGRIFEGITLRCFFFTFGTIFVPSQTSDISKI